MNIKTMIVICKCKECKKRVVKTLIKKEFMTSDSKCPYCNAMNSLEITEFDFDSRKELSMKDITKMMSDKLNCMGPRDNIKEFVKYISKEHRTLQQIFFKTFMKTIKMWAEMKKLGYYDDRNKATVELSERIVKEVGEEGIPFI